MELSHINNRQTPTNPLSSDRLEYDESEIKVIASLTPTTRKFFVISKRMVDLTNKLDTAGCHFNELKEKEPGLFNSVSEYKEYIHHEIDRLKDSVINAWPDYIFPAQNKMPNVYLKVTIPEDEYPDYNFVGMLIGPKGVTQREIEHKTGAKLLIVGTSIHEEFGGKHNSLQYKSDEPLHLKINGPSKKSIEAAYELVKPLLVPK